MGGDIPLLPSENYAATHYEPTEETPAEEVPVDPVEGIGSDLAPVDLSGIEEAAIVLGTQLSIFKSSMLH